MLNQEIRDQLLTVLESNHKSSPILFGIIASTLATIGLATNSSTTLLGAMLLSPIGALIVKSNIYAVLKKHNCRVKRKYQFWGLSLIFVIIITLVLSFLIGKIFSNIRNPFTGEKLNEKWPTTEMKDRADPSNGIYMVVIALMCGIALPMSIITNSSTRFVAIGIATALIPPLANIGLSFSMQVNEHLNEDELYEYRRRAVITGVCIFAVNVLLLWIPNKYLLDIFVQKENWFKHVEQAANTAF